MEKRDRLLELADASAARGLAALGTFLCCPLQGASRAQEWEPADLRRLGAPRGSAVALCADLDGAVGGRLVVLLEERTAKALVRPIVHREGPGRELLECSALLEGGNVVFSAAAGALGDAIGVVVFPSVPRLWCEGQPGFARDLRCDAADTLGAYAVFAEAQLEGGTRPLGLIWLPTLSE